jgi:hypothetical protein
MTQLLTDLTLVQSALNGVYRSQSSTSGHIGLGDLLIEMVNSIESAGANTSLNNLVSPTLNTALNMGTFQINALANPTSAQDAATKSYVDTAIAGVGVSFNILAFTSNPTVGGAAVEAVTVTGLLSTDTILSVSQKTKGGANLPILGWSSQVTNGISIIYSADMGPGAVVLVAVKR